MNESTLFRRALAVLGATIVAPLFVAATGVGGEKVATEVRLDNYVQNVATAEKKDTQKKDDTTVPVVDGNDKSSDGASMSDPGSMASAPKAGAKAAGSYTVKAGDTYGCIAEKYYGSYEMWPRVYELNGGYPGFEEYHLDVGAKLQMPAVSASEALPKTSLCN